MRYGAQLGSAALYACVSALLVFSNKALPSVFDFNYPIAMLMFQMLLLQVILLGLGVTRMIKPPQLTAKGFLVHLPVSFLYCLNASLALASLQAVSIPTYGVLKRAGPLFIVLISGAAKHVHAAMRARRDAVGDPQELLMEKKRNLQRQLREIELRLTGADTAKLEEGLLQEGGRDAETGQAGDGLSPKQKGAGEREAADDSGPGVVAGVVIIVVGALLTGYSDLYLTTSTLTIALLSNVTQSLYVLMVEAKNHGKAGVGIKFDYGEGAGLCQCLCIAESFAPKMTRATSQTQRLDCSATTRSFRCRCSESSQRSSTSTRALASSGSSTRDSIPARCWATCCSSLCSESASTTPCSFAFATTRR